jgi:hypothetical protein
MTQRALVRTAASVAFIVLSTGSAASDCERRNAEAEHRDNTRSDSQVVVRADDDVCWKVTVDGKAHKGCGDAKIYRYDSDQQVRAERVDGHNSVDVSMKVNGKTTCRKKVDTTGKTVVVKADNVVVQKN